MPTNPTSPFADTQTHHGVYVVDGYGAKLHVHRGHLIIEDGAGRQRRSRRLHKATTDIRRIVLVAHSGFLTVDAIRWLADAGISLTHLDSDSRILATSPGHHAPDKAALRRAQAWAATNDTGLDITRSILTRKLDGQAANAQRLEADPSAIKEAATSLAIAVSLDHMMNLEGQAAATYWQAWNQQPVTFARKDEQRVPEHWRTFGTRSSSLTSSPRLATNPANAILNYLYALLEAETRNACIAVGLDPGIGILHADQPARDSLALDLMEAVRPHVDAYLLDLLEGHVFAARDFIDTRRGTCRINRPLTHRLAETAPTWARHVAPIAEYTAKSLARTPGINPTRVPTPLTQSNRSNSRNTTRRTRRTPMPPLPPERCPDCGQPSPQGRKHCNTCQPAHQDDNLQSFITQQHEALARLREQGQDPAHGGQAAQRRGNSISTQNRKSHEWDRQHPNRPPKQIFQQQILPKLQTVTIAEMAGATGLSGGYCSMIRRGLKTPHPRHWPVLARLAG